MTDTRLDLTEAELDALLKGWGVVSALLMGEEGATVGAILMDKLDSEKHYPGLASLTDKLGRIQHEKTKELISTIRDRFNIPRPERVANL